MYVLFPVSLRNMEDLLHERGIDISHQSVCFWWNRFRPLFAVKIRSRRSSRMRGDIGNGTIVIPCGGAFVFKGLLIKVFVCSVIRLGGHDAQTGATRRREAKFGPVSDRVPHRSRR